MDKQNKNKNSTNHIERERQHLTQERKMLTKSLHLMKHLKMVPLTGVGLIFAELVKAIVLGKAIHPDLVLLFTILGFLLSGAALYIILAEGDHLAEKEYIDERIDDLRKM